MHRRLYFTGIHIRMSLLLQIQYMARARFSSLILQNFKCNCIVFECWAFHDPVAVVWIFTVKQWSIILTNFLSSNSLGIKVELVLIILYHLTGLLAIKLKKKSLQKYSLLLVLIFQNQLTASNSRSLKMNFKDILYGIIATTKKGKAKAIGLDLTAHRTARPINWMMVYKCIFQVRT